MSTESALSYLKKAADILRHPKETKQAYKENIADGLDRIVECIETPCEWKEFNSLGLEWFESGCDTKFTFEYLEKPKYCPKCGSKIKWIK